MTPIASAFAILIAALHVSGPCPMPHVLRSSDIIATTCQHRTLPGNHADACYFPASQTIVLRTDWDADSHYDQRMLFHEMDRYIEQACLGHVFHQAEPESVLAAEALAP